MAGTPGLWSARQGQRALAGRQATWMVAWLPLLVRLGCWWSWGPSFPSRNGGVDWDSWGPALRISEPGRSSLEET